MGGSLAIHGHYNHDPLLLRLPARSLVRSFVPALPCPALPCRLPCRIDACLHLPMQECLPAPHFSSPLLSPPLLAAPTRLLLCVTSPIALLPASRHLRSLAIAPIMACSRAQHTHSSITTHHITPASSPPISPPSPPSPQASLPPRLHALGPRPARLPSALRPVSLYHLLYPSQSTRPASHLSHPPLPVSHPLR
jgi:hypothetical protein